VSVAIAHQVRDWIDDAMVHGGDRQRAARKAEAIIGGLVLGRPIDEVGRSTSHGESRLRCTKYDLGNGFRLVILLRSSGVVVLHLDHHDGTDRWLNAQQGKVFHLDGIEEAIELPSPDEPEPEPPAVEPDAPTRLIAPLPDGEFDDLPIKPSAMRALTRLTTQSSDRELADAVTDLGELKTDIFQVLQFLRNGDNHAAYKTLHALHEVPEPEPPEAEPSGQPEPEPEPIHALSKKQRRAARRAARSGGVSGGDSSYQTMDKQTLKALTEQKAQEAKRSQAEAAQRQQQAEQRGEDELSFGELLERFERGESVD